MPLHNVPYNYIYFKKYKVKYHALGKKVIEIEFIISRLVIWASKIPPKLSNEN